MQAVKVATERQMSGVSDKTLEKPNARSQELLVRVCGAPTDGRTDGRASAHAQVQVTSSLCVRERAICLHKQSCFSPSSLELSTLSPEGSERRRKSSGQNREGGEREAKASTTLLLASFKGHLQLGRSPAGRRHYVHAYLLHICGIGLVCVRCARERERAPSGLFTNEHAHTRLLSKKSPQKVMRRKKLEALLSSEKRFVSRPPSVSTHIRSRE